MHVTLADIAELAVPEVAFPLLTARIVREYLTNSRSDAPEQAWQCLTSSHPNEQFTFNNR